MTPIPSMAFLFHLPGNTMGASPADGPCTFSEFACAYSRISTCIFTNITVRIHEFTSWSPLVPLSTPFGANPIPSGKPWHRLRPTRQHLRSAPSIPPPGLPQTLPPTRSRCPTRPTVGIISGLPGNLPQREESHPLPGTIPHIMFRTNGTEHKCTFYTPQATITFNLSGIPFCLIFVKKATFVQHISIQSAR